MRSLTCFNDAVCFCDASAEGWPIRWANEKWEVLTGEQEGLASAVVGMMVASTMLGGLKRLLGQPMQQTGTHVSCFECAVSVGVEEGWWRQVEGGGILPSCRPAKMRLHRTSPVTGSPSDRSPCRPARFRWVLPGQRAAVGYTRRSAPRGEAAGQAGSHLQSNRVHHRARWVIVWLERGGR